MTTSRNVYTEPIPIVEHTPRYDKSRTARARRRAIAMRTARALKGRGL